MGGGVLLSACTSFIMKMNKAETRLRFYLIIAILHFLDKTLLFLRADYDSSYMMNSSCRDANVEPKVAAVPDGMCHCVRIHF